MIEKIQKFILDAVADSRDFDEALDLCLFYAELVNINHLNSYNFPELEKLVFAKFCASSGWSAKDHINTSDEVLHVISEGYKSGGHTRLMERLALMQPGDCNLLVTRRNDCEHKDIFKNIYLNSCEKHSDALRFFLSVFKKHKKIVLHIHPNDILLVLAVKLLRLDESRPSVFFVNHADHQFSYGRHDVDMVLEVGCFGKFLKSQMGGEYFSGFLGIPIEFDFSEKIKNNFRPLDNHIYTAGSSWKMKPLRRFSFQKKVAEILKARPDLNFSAVGIKAGRDRWWWPLKARFPSRVRLIRTMPYVEYLKFIEQRKIYLDSFPFSGGTAYVEAYLKGNFPVGLQTLATGYTPLDWLRVDSVQGLLDIFKSPDDYIQRLGELNGELAYWHAHSEVKARYVSALSGHAVPMPAMASNQNIYRYPSLVDNKSWWCWKCKFTLSQAHSAWFAKFVMQFFWKISWGSYTSLIWKKLKNK